MELITTLQAGTEAISLASALAQQIKDSKSKNNEDPS